MHWRLQGTGGSDARVGVLSRPAARQVKVGGGRVWFPGQRISWHPTVNLGITQYAELEETSQDYRVELLALPSAIPKNPSMCLGALSKHFLNAVTLGAVDHFPREPVSVPNHPLGEKPFPRVKAVCTE